MCMCNVYAGTRTDAKIFMSVSCRQKKTGVYKKTVFFSSYKNEKCCLS